MNPSPFLQPEPSLPPVAAPTNVSINTTTQSNKQPFNDMAFMQQFSANMIAAQQSQSIIVESCTDKCRESEAKFNNNMLQLVLVGGNICRTQVPIMVGIRG
jgi:hypothetical protein